uniref:Uncharacterized protein n=1 Tax=Meloidogyne javanica TaxID=6303 RepID=A0A915MZN6_MELJA
MVLEEEFNELANLEEFARIDEQTICDAIACDFETGTLCEWEASIDELHPSDPRYKRYLMARRQHIMDRMMRKMVKRSKRDAEQNEEEEAKGEEIVEKVPKKKKNNKNKLKFFSTRNQRFAASYLKPGQRSTLTGRVLSGEQANIRFWVWEATRDLQLRVCCDDTNDRQCVFQTDRGVKRGSRRWVEQDAMCPQGTKKVFKFYR